MNAHLRAAWVVATACLAGASLAGGPAVLAWAACLLAGAGLWPTLRALRPHGLHAALLALPAAAASALAGQPALAAAALAAAAAAAGPVGDTLTARTLRRLIPGGLALAAVTWALRGPTAALAALAAVCVAASLLQAADGAVRVCGARAGVLLSGPDAVHAGAAVDGVVLQGLQPTPAPWRRTPGAPLPPVAAAAGTGAAGRSGERAGRTWARRRCGGPAAGPGAAEPLRRLGCEVWQRGGSVVPLRRRADADAFAVADMLARGRHVAVVVEAGTVPPAADLTVQVGGQLPAGAGPAIVLPDRDLGRLAAFLRMARRASRLRCLLAAAAALAGGPGVALGASGHLRPALVTWATLAAAAACAGAPIFTNSQRNYG